MKITLGEQPLEGNSFEFVPCALFFPKTETDQLIYELYCLVGRHCEDVDKCGSYSAFAAVYGTVGYCLYYNGGCEFKGDWIPWEVPRWAIGMCSKIRGLAQAAEEIGHERGYSTALSSGKNFVTRLAAGDITMAEFDKADGRDSIRLSRKKWAPIQPD